MVANITIGKLNTTRGRDLNFTKTERNFGSIEVGQEAKIQWIISSILIVIVLVLIVLVIRLHIKQRKVSVEQAPNELEDIHFREEEIQNLQSSEKSK